MADSKVPTVASVPNIEVAKPGEKRISYEKRIQQSQINKGSRYPPFSIEPFINERSRTANRMTAEDRFLRKQWLQDQILSPNEPRHVPEAIPRHSLRQMYRKPWDMIEGGLRKVMNPTAAGLLRFFVPKLMLGYVALVAGYYHIKYNSNHWTKYNAIQVYGSRIARFKDEDPLQFPADPETFNHGNFHLRKTHFNVKTSAADCE